MQSHGNIVDSSLVQHFQASTFCFPSVVFYACSFLGGYRAFLRQDAALLLVVASRYCLIGGNWMKSLCAPAALENTLFVSGRGQKTCCPKQSTKCYASRGE